MSDKDQYRIGDPFVTERVWIAAAGGNLGADKGATPADALIDPQDATMPRCPESRRAQRRDTTSADFQSRAVQGSAAVEPGTVTQMLSRMIRTAPLAVGVLAVGLSFVPAGISRASEVPTAVQLLKMALSDAKARGSVHESTVEVAGSRRVTFSDDVANDSGRQNITVSGGVSAHVLVIGKTAYISGNQAALIRYFGFPRADATVIGDRWISLTSTSPGYATVASDATLPSALGDDFTANGKLTELGATKMDGVSVVGLRAVLPPSFGAKGTMTIYVTRSSHPLPVVAILKASHAGKTVSSMSSLSDWGEPVSVRRPADVIASNKL